ncbi:hypothetical protein [Jiangella gansuensis]|uniref:hypothetical protein n=1 Tax=Jiangella gansuensis TaxID=281473 RepID=UPI0004B3F291|nr:hypothetical protein [Jiangella gansuensis]
MSDRSIRAAAEALAALPGETEAAADALAAEITRLTGGITTPLRTVRDQPLRGLPDEIDRGGRAMADIVRGLSGDIAAVVAGEVRDLTALLEGAPGTPETPTAAGTPAVTGTTPAGRTEPDDVAAAVEGALGEAHPDVAALVARLVADVAHPLDLTRALADPRRRHHTLAMLSELADGRALAGRTLEQYRAENPGRGPLFEPVPAEALTTADGRSRKKLFLAHARDLDPARAIGAEPTREERALLDDYVRRLSRQVQPYVRAELEALAAPFDDAAVSLRVKDTEGIIDKVQRMSSGSADRPGRPDYRVGEVVDAVGARITVGDTAELAGVVTAVVNRYGVGDGGNVLDMENMYAEPKRHNPAYRVVPFIIGASLDGLPYTFEIQLCTRRASIASDLEHNTVYKPYVPVGDGERDRVRGMQAEAAALDQDETRSEQR